MRFHVILLVFLVGCATSSYVDPIDNPFDDTVVEENSHDKLYKVGNVFYQWNDKLNVCYEHVTRTITADKNCGKEGHGN